jgi:hypothetical protein
VIRDPSPPVMALVADGVLPDLVDVGVLLPPDVDVAALILEALFFLITVK